VLAGGLGRHKWHDRRVLSDRRGLLGLGRHEQLLLVDEDGAVLETEQASVFAVFGEVVRTPPVDGRILAGTTREAVVRLAALEGFEVSEEPFALADLASAEEVFLTSSIRGLCTVGGLRLSRSFQAGPVSARLAKALWTLWNRVLYRNLGLVPDDVRG
jgi:branched-subunit amino acid aminotransferase/4-amino-4-deoxychorismate lyase